MTGFVRQLLLAFYSQATMATCAVGHLADLNTAPFLASHPHENARTSLPVDGFQEKQRTCALHRCKESLVLYVPRRAAWSL